MKAAAQKLPYPAKQADMKLQPDSDLANYQAAGKLKDKVALITGADSGIGRAVAIAFAKEGAHVAIVFNENVEDAEKTKQMVEKEKRKCLLLQLDVRDPEQCRQAVRRTLAELGGLNILVNNAAFQMSQEKFEDIPEEQIRRTFDTNILGYIWMAQAAIPHLQKGRLHHQYGQHCGHHGHSRFWWIMPATKAGIHALTKSLALYLGEQGIRVNCVVPGPVWTPNIPGTMPHGGNREIRPRSCPQAPRPARGAGPGLRAAGLAGRLVYDRQPGARDGRQAQQRRVARGCKTPVIPSAAKDLVADEQFAVTQLVQT